MRAIPAEHNIDTTAAIIQEPDFIYYVPIDGHKWEAGITHLQGFISHTSFKHTVGDPFIETHRWISMWEVFKARDIKCGFRAFAVDIEP